ncbi:MAG: RNA polymerase sigma factor [Bacteroidales bacterium]
METDEFITNILPAKDILFRTALRYVGNREVAEDMVQETLLRMWDVRQNWPKIGSYRAYMVTMLRNLCFDYLRSSGRLVVPLDQLPPAESHSASPSESLEQEEALNCLHTLIDALPEMQRNVVLLRVVEGFSYKEIGEALRISPAMVKITLFRAKHRIKLGMRKIVLP